MKDKNININLNIDSVMDYVRCKEDEVNILRTSNLKMRIKLDRILEKLKSFEYYIPEDEKLELIDYLENYNNV